MSSPSDLISSWFRGARIVKYKVVFTEDFRETNLKLEATLDATDLASKGACSPSDIENTAPRGLVMDETTVNMGHIMTLDVACSLDPTLQYELAMAIAKDSLPFKLEQTADYYKAPDEN